MIKNYEKMVEQASEYMLCFDEVGKKVYLIKHKGEVKISTKRAIEWVEVGIDDIDCRSKNEMLEILKGWL